MGYVRHNAMAVTGKEGYKEFTKAHDKAKELFGVLVTPVIKGITNGCQTFFVAPDGSKEDWEESDFYDGKRIEFADYLDSLAYEDGSSCLNFVDLGYDECFEAKIDRTNKEMEDED